jgi:hypothetical protein
VGNFPPSSADLTVYMISWLVHVDLYQETSSIANVLVHLLLKQITQLSFGHNSQKLVFLLISLHIFPFIFFVFQGIRINALHPPQSAYEKQTFKKWWQILLWTFESHANKKPSFKKMNTSYQRLIHKIFI